MTYKTCNKQDKYSKEDIANLFSSFGTERDRGRLLSQISNLDYEEATGKLTLIICVLSNMERKPESLRLMYERVTQLRQTMIDIEMRFIENEYLKASKEMKSCENKIKRQLTTDIDEDAMYADWMARLEKGHS